MGAEDSRSPAPRGGHAGRTSAGGPGERHVDEASWRSRRALRARLAATTCTPAYGTRRRIRLLPGRPSWRVSSTRWIRTALLILGSELVGLNTRARPTSSGSPWPQPMRVGPAVGAVDQAPVPTGRKAGEVSPSRDTARVRRGRKGPNATRVRPSEAIAETEAPVGLASAFFGHRGPVPAQHLR